MNGLVCVLLLARLDARDEDDQRRRALAIDSPGKVKILSLLPQDQTNGPLGGRMEETSAKPQLHAIGLSPKWSHMTGCPPDSGVEIDLLGLLIRSTPQSARSGSALRSAPPLNHRRLLFSRRT
ncbi:hypothetical protein LZ30DRAFT_687364 [Colletotrichum cereale]|nr:hypothetical protein LZ30DRAFT_687364 [Colletotrichum cereale]